MPVPRSLYLVGAAAAPVGVCASALAPAAGVLAGTIAVGLALLLSVAGALLAADWRAEVGSRRAWAEAAAAGAGWKAGAGLDSADVDTGYLPASETDALRRLFRVHRPLESQGAAVVELPAASSASQPASTLAFPTRTDWEGLQGTDRGSDAGGSAGDGPADLATLERSRPAKSLSVAAGGGVGGSYRVAGGAVVRLAVNAGFSWPASGRALAAPSRGGEVVVLTSCRDAQRTRPAEAATETGRGTGIQPPSCRGPPSLGRQRPARDPAGRTAPPRRVSPDGDPLVRDNLGQPVPICAAEVAVIETYLGDALEELFASSKPSAGPERT